MSDWIPADKREHADTCQVVLLPEQSLPCRCLVAHALVADARIAERDELIHALAFALQECLEHGHDPVLGEYRAGNAALKRVEAYQKEQTQ